MKRKSIYILSLAMICCVGCTNKVSVEEVKSSSKAEMKTLAYKDLLDNDNPLLTVINIKDCNKVDALVTPFVHTRNWDDNTYVDLLDKYNVKFHTEFDMESFPNDRCINLRRKTTIRRVGETGSNSSDLEVSIMNNVMPITIIRPYVEECAIIPKCYYEDMEIEWTGDSNNTQGIIVLIQWTGTVLDGEGNREAIYNVCLLEDSGVATLDNAMFDNIPDQAYVTMFLIRADILQVQENDETVNFEDYDWEAIIDAYPEVGCQATNVAIGNAAKLSFILIREFY